MVKRYINTSIKQWVLLAFILVLGNLQALAGATEGKVIFESKCKACHAMDAKLVGPALRGVTDKYSEKWLLSWVKNNSKFALTDEKAKEVRITGGMTTFEDLSDIEIKSILTYIKEAPAKKVASVTAGGANEVNQKSFPWWVWLLLLILLIVILMLVRNVTNQLNRHAETLNTKEPKKEMGKFMTWYSRRNKLILKSLLGTVVFMALAAYFYPYATSSIGVQKGYAPTQPIKYSHKLHAGDLKIDCQYCHSIASESKHASIPSLSTCMNCHKGVQLREQNGGEISPEIQKIYTALDYDPNGNGAAAYGNNPKPIKWVRIHNLPDLAYFNHSQHVNVGKVECQTCHGPIEKMETVQQWNTLQMGWCIDCHRKTGIDVENNDYYAKLHSKAKEDIEKNGKDSKYHGANGKMLITESMNGGLECAKCHY